MKLRNKKTGEIVSLEGELLFDNKVRLLKQYNSLAELNEEWEDVPEEPSKTIWQIKDSGELQDFEEDVFSDGYIESSKSIGNHFETKEEAEKAVEKLKAWKRLKDNGFKFQFWTSEYSGDKISFFIDWINADSKKEIEDDLDLLFGGEE